MRWLVDEWQWPYAGALVAVFLLALLPLWWDATDTALALVYAALPLYMLHQLEEHAGDRFRLAITPGSPAGVRRSPAPPRSGLTPGPSGSST